MKKDPSTRNGIVLTPSPCLHEAAFDGNTCSHHSETSSRINIEMNRTVYGAEATPAEFSHHPAADSETSPNVLVGRMSGTGDPVYRSNVPQNPGARDPS